MDELEKKGKFNVLLHKLHIDMPFLHALGEMPKFARNLKELLKHKKGLSGVSKVCLNEEYSTILHKGCPQKMGDPGAFVVPSDQLVLPSLTPTRLSIRLADGSIRYPKGIAEDMLVQVKGFIILVDFVVVDVGSDDLDIPLIFGRPLLATCRAIIDVGTDKLTLRIGNEEAKFALA
ncbi:PREDICTED: uncharacterized protein LOC109183051 [Ipomoea nil]|uniref:uncharacterized protein LOC109183051 n=1 Tax=Ipomoea nil TaxID=35883 RepID=UPI0009009CE5|nr:PREDICTED: uncharacterized protein LOC109183051 [Ipomoea nil]